MSEQENSLSDRDIAYKVETTEAEAYADLLRAAPAEWRCVAEQTRAGWLLLAPKLDVLLFNRVIGIGIESPVRQADVAELIARYRATGIRNFGIQVSPVAQPPALRGWLESESLILRDRWTKVYRSGAPVRPVTTELRVEPVKPEQAAMFAAVTAIGFGMPAELQPWIASTVLRPQWRHYMAWNGPEPVAAAALFIYGDTAWLGMASTLPAARRRGAQSGLVAKRLQDGSALGCRWFVTETAEDLPERPNPSFRNLIRAGFTIAYHRSNFLPAHVSSHI